MALYSYYFFNNDTMSMPFSFHTNNKFICDTGILYHPHKHPDSSWTRFGWYTLDESVNTKIARYHLQYIVYTECRDVHCDKKDEIQFQLQSFSYIQLLLCTAMTISSSLPHAGNISTHANALGLKNRRNIGIVLTILRPVRPSVRPDVRHKT